MQARLVASRRIQNTTDFGIERRVGGAEPRLVAGAMKQGTTPRERALPDQSIEDRGRRGRSMTGRSVATSSTERPGLSGSAACVSSNRAMRIASRAATRAAGKARRRSPASTRRTARAASNPSRAARARLRTRAKRGGRAPRPRRPAAVEGRPVFRLGQGLDLGAAGGQPCSALGPLAIDDPAAAEGARGGGIAQDEAIAGQGTDRRIEDDPREGRAPGGMGDESGASSTRPVTPAAPRWQWIGLRWHRPAPLPAAGAAARRGASSAHAGRGQAPNRRGGWPRARGARPSG